jgi:uncharacterized protein (DUF2062 family)
MTTAVARFAGWVRRTMPTREAMARSRWVPARALESQLWRFNRRSVPRGVALGLLVGILLPVAQVVLAAILCLPGRANVPVAALTTFVTNPFTTPFIWAASYAVGASLLRVDASVAGGPIDHLLAVTDGWALLEWITSEGRVLALGLVVVAVVAAAAGYLLTSFAWRWWIVQKRRRAHEARA